MAYIGQAEDEWEAAQAKKARKAKAAALRRGPACPQCRAKFLDAGRLKNHMRDKHGMSGGEWKEFMSKPKHQNIIPVFVSCRPK